MPKAKKRGSSYRVRVYDYTDADGTKHYKSFTAETKSEAEMLAAEYKAGRIDRSKGRLRLTDAIDRYIAAKESVLSPTTITGYHTIQKHHLQNLMDVFVSEITPEMVQAEISKEARTSSPKTVRNVHGLLSSVLSMYAPHIRLQTKLPQTEIQELEIPDNDDIQAMISASSADPILQLAIMLASMGPLRISEVCALTISDVDGNVVSVNKAMVPGVDKKDWVIKQPKTRYGKRKIQYPDYVIQMIQPDKDGRIIPINPNTLYERYKRMLRRSGLPPYTFHALRHYGASMLMSNGFPVDYVMERGGWESRETLERIYQHVMSSKKKELNARLMENLNRFRPEMDI